MNSRLAALVAALVLAARASAQPVADHLACYKIKDPQAKTTYTADLGGLVAEPGCTIKVPAVLACVPATKANVTPTPPGGGGTGTPNSFFCYKVKCPKATPPTLTGTDQFGNRTVTPSGAKILCAPLAGPPTTTTTTATTTSTTTTTLRFVDNGDGTVTDHQTDLIWEKKVAGTSCLHCVNDSYTWSSSGTAPDGTAFTGFLDTLNGGATGVGNCVSADGNNVTGGFNGHCDWRLPSVAELNSIVDSSAAGCGSGSPCIDPIFGPTQAYLYWSSTTTSGDPNGAWDVAFGSQDASLDGKTIGYFVRAVRGGS
jgi:hypothetical protein